MHQEQRSALPLPADQATDADLARRAAQGEGHAFEAIMRQARSQLLVPHRRHGILRSDADTEDTLQDAPT